MGSYFVQILPPCTIYISLMSYKLKQELIQQEEEKTIFFRISSNNAERLIYMLTHSKRPVPLHL